MKQFLSKYFKYLLLALLLYMPVFGFLDTLPIRVWDESRLAINALEMYDNGNYIVTHFNHTPDMWNTKPPLMIWCQVFFMKTIGLNEIAVRLPSSIAVFLTCLALLVFCMRYLKSFWLGFITIILLITSDGYMNFHVARTGDYDAMLVFFTTSGCLFFYAFCETKKNKFLYLFFTALTLGVLTKGIAALLFLPAYFIFCLVQWEFKAFLKNKHFYFGLLLFLVIGVGYYFLRDAMNPGFISTIQETELGGRFLVSQGKTKFDFWFYYNNFMVYRLPDRYLLIPCGFLIGLFSKNPRIKKFSVYLFLVVITFFIIISSAKTKLEWYDAPLYPLLSFLIAFFVYFFFELLKDWTYITQILKYNVIPFIFLFLIFISHYKVAWERTYSPSEYFWDKDFYEIGHFLQDAARGKYDLKNNYLVYDGYNAQNDFYLRVLNHKGVNVAEKNLSQIKQGDILIVCQENIKQHIKTNFVYEQLRERGPVAVFKIIKC